MCNHRNLTFATWCMTFWFLFWNWYLKLEIWDLKFGCGIWPEHFVCCKALSSPESDDSSKTMPILRVLEGFHAETGFSLEFSRGLDRFLKNVSSEMQFPLQILMLADSHQSQNVPKHIVKWRFSKKNDVRSALGWRDPEKPWFSGFWQGEFKSRILIKNVIKKWPFLGSARVPPCRADFGGTKNDRFLVSEAFSFDVLGGCRSWMCSNTS